MSAPDQSNLPALLIAGPTASGKSALALAIAEACDGTIINTDSMQVYAELRILTARPTVAEEARVPHLLYGVRPAAEAGSVAWWRAAALEAMAQARAAGRLPILCGGSGMYFATLTEGIADIPAIDPNVRAAARALVAEIGPTALHGRLRADDPATAENLRPTDSQRLARAWEVLRSTGHGLAYWHSHGTGPAQEKFCAILLDPPREDLRAAIASRFAAMLAEGALDEARALLALGLDPALPAMRAHGVPELAAYLRGEISLEEAERRAGLVTGQYTKRQATWFRHHKLASDGSVHIIHARISTRTQFSESAWAEILTFVRDRG